MKRLLVLVACEFSGVVRDAFIEKGHVAFSCDIRPATGNHLQGDVRNYLDLGWDLMVAHPPCTHLAVSGAKHFHKKKKRQKKALEFVLTLLNAPIRHICLENPVSVISTWVGPPTQIIQPWQYGDSFQKTTCLWLKNLPRLRPTRVVDKGKMVTFTSGKKMPAWYNNANAKERSVTFSGIAKAMASQWGDPRVEGLGIDFPYGYRRRE